MVKWHDTWLEKTDSNGIKMRKWAKKVSSTHAYCKLCNRELKFDLMGIQALIQHSGKPTHEQISNEAFGSNTRRFEVSNNAPASSTSSASSTTTGKSYFIGASQKDKVSAAEAMWLFKIAQGDLSLRDSDDASALFQAMFSDSEIAKDFTMGRSKASYVLQDGLGPLLATWLCKKLRDSEGGYTLMFDETTTEQEKKQMDILLRFWDETLKRVSTKYLTSLFFARGTALDITDMMTNLMENSDYDLPWKKLFDISADGPNINKAIWRELNKKLKEKGFSGLLEFISCTIHTIHNAFHTGIKNLGGFGEMVEQLAFDLHAWFKHSPCKSEDFIKMADSITRENEALFIRHLNTRWLTLSPCLEVILKRWEDCSKYFLQYLPTQKEYKRYLPSNKRYLRIKQCLKDQEKVSLCIFSCMRA